MLKKELPAAFFATCLIQDTEFHEIAGQWCTTSWNQIYVYAGHLENKTENLQARHHSVDTPRCADMQLRKYQDENVRSAGRVLSTTHASISSREAGPLVPDPQPNSASTGLSLCFSPEMSTILDTRPEPKQKTRYVKNWVFFFFFWGKTNDFVSQKSAGRDDQRPRLLKRPSLPGHVS